MFFPGKLKAVLLVSILVLAGMYWANLDLRPPIRQGSPLPEGRVKPILGYGVLLAPDGSLWKMEHSGSGSPTSLTLHPFAPGNNWKEVSGNLDFALALKQDGTLWGWQSLYPMGFFSKVPVKIGQESDWSQVSTGKGTAVLIKRDGSLWGIGDDYLGKGSAFMLHPGGPPVRIGSSNDWIAVENCSDVAYGLQRDGSIWQWGKTERGRFALTPTRIGNRNDWTTIANCTEALAALNKDGTLWVTGEKAHRVAFRFASGPATDFVQIGVDNDWQELIGGARSLLARRTDGTWWATGENHFSQLGVSSKLEVELGQPTRVLEGLKVWTGEAPSDLWRSGHARTGMFLCRDGSFYYTGVTPSYYLLPGRITQAKRAANNALRKLPGSPKLFSDPEPPQSPYPVKIGELPPSVISSLGSTK